jgi:hypothetical protein
MLRSAVGRGAVAVAAVAGLLLMGATRAAVATTPPIAVPAAGTAYFGVHLDPDTPDQYVQRSGIRPAVYGKFAAVPFDASTKRWMSTVVDQVKAHGGKLFLTLEPNGGLSTITAGAARTIASTIAGYNSRGVDVFVRFGQEMNGSWYVWGQKPAAYVAAYRRVADAVHSAAPHAAMVWAPTYGGGYPFAGGASSPKAGSADFTALDTNHDGGLTAADDPYAPYYPGDAYVDWVGLSAYHFGNTYPWGANVVPAAGKLGQFLHGTYTGNGDESVVPDFYQDYAVAKGKPMAIAETGALYNEAPPAPGDSEVSIKDAWIDQVYGTRADLPQVKLIAWFEIEKLEGAVNSRVDWRATTNPDVLAHLKSVLAGGGYLSGT